MGTPDIAAVTLTRLVSDGHNIVAAVTGEDKVRGRGNVLTPTPVKKVAQECGIPVYTPKTLKDEAFSELLREIVPDLIIVVAYGKILPPNVIDFPRFGCVNMHVSLLPKYRGAAPMQRAIIDGERETGVTIMYMDAGLDTGEKDDDFEAIHDRSALLGSDLLSKVIPEIEAGNAKRVAQDSSLATYAKKIEKEDAKIDFTKSAKELDFLVRGVTPIPGAFAYLGDKVLKITKQEPTTGRGTPGEVIATDAKGDGSFTVACGDGAMRILSVVLEGKGKMSAGDFVRGRRISVGDVLH